MRKYVYMLHLCIAELLTVYDRYAAELKFSKRLNHLVMSNYFLCRDWIGS